MDIKGKHVLVVGLARSGVAVARALARRGAIVTVSDRKHPSEFSDVLPQLLKDKMGLELGMQREETFLRQDLIVTSPGVPWDLAQLQAARGRNIPVYPEVEAASWFLEGTLVGITGSNGKTTTTSLLGDMLKASGLPTFVGGNIGNALSVGVDQAQPGTRFVTELSSFQLEGIHEFHPHVAVMLNLSPNHLDRHPSLEAYAEAKRQIFRNQQSDDYAVLNADDPWVAGLRESVSSHPVMFSRRRELADGVFVSEGKIYYRVRHLERELFETRDVTLRGDFNLEDVLAATTAACLLGADFAAIRRAVRDFQAVEHRLEFVREIRSVDFFNNSKATSVDATLKSLEAFDHGIHLILGGKDKGAPYTPLLPLIKERAREVLVIGAAAPVITEQLAGSVELVQAGDLATAVHEAFARSRPGDTVLLAPACSSFDQFKDYEERGRVFKELVEQLAQDVAAGRVRVGGYGTRGPEPAAGDAGPRTRESEVETRDSGRENRESGVGKQVSELGIGEAETASQESALDARDLGVTGPAIGPPAVAGPEPEAASDRIAFADASEESDELARFTPNVAPEKAARKEDESLASGPEISNIESQVAILGFRVPSLEPQAPSAGSSIAAPHHVELRYVYEVDAVDMPAAESQAVVDDEPTVDISDSAEVLDDDVLPFEIRRADQKSKARPNPRQPKLFDASDD